VTQLIGSDGSFHFNSTHDLEQAGAAHGKPADKVDLTSFNSWVDKQRAASPPDIKDAEDFKYITFTEKPPFTPAHKSLMSKLLTDDLWNKYKNAKTSKGEP
jgi:hypothetical protein